MAYEKILFYVFAAILIFASCMVITSRNAVRAVLFLVLAFVATSALWVLLQAEYLAMVLIIVYVGAVMILFLYVVMMLDLNIAPLKEGYNKTLPIAALVSLLLVFELVYIYLPKLYGFNNLTKVVSRDASFSNIKMIADVMYTEYLLAFELSAVILLVAMVAAVTLTFRGTKNRKSQNIRNQVKTEKNQRLRIVKNMGK